jgi:serine protease Do
MRNPWRAAASSRNIGLLAVVMECLVVRGGVVKPTVIRIFPSVLLALWLIALPGLAAAKPAPDGFADLAARLLPAVVNISTTQTIPPDKTSKNGVGPAPQAERDDQQSAPDTPVPSEKKSPFDDFFKDFFDREGKHPMPRHAISLGSGFIIDPSGLVVTNNHVIADAGGQGHQDRSRPAAHQAGEGPARGYLRQQR